MELMEGLLTRRSVRKFTDQKIEKKDIEDLITAAQYSPSAHNTQPWEFVVIEDKEILKKIRHVQRSASFAENAPVVIVVCGNKDKAFHREKEGWSYLEIDCAAATENILLAAHSRGIGACWCGISPMTKPIEAVSELLDLPENIQPFSFVVLGYPQDEPKQPEHRADLSKILWK